MTDHTQLRYNDCWI